MKKISVFLFIIAFHIVAFKTTANASAIAWNETSALLSTLTLYTTDTLSIHFDEDPGDSLLTAGTKIYLEDLYWSSYGYWFAYKSAHSSISLNFTASGSGNLEASIEYSINVGALNYAIPDSSGGEDTIIWLFIKDTNDETNYDHNYDYMDEPSVPTIINGIVDTRSCSPCLSVFFDDGDTGNITIDVESYLWVRYNSYPAPIPEPATMLLLGSGLMGLAGFRSKFKKA